MSVTAKFKGHISAEESKFSNLWDAVSATTGCKYILIFFSAQKPAHLHPKPLQEEELEQKAERRFLRPTYPPLLFNFRGQGEN